MANAFDPGQEPDSAPDAGDGPPDAGGSQPPPGAPPGGGPLLAMLGRQQMSPPVTAPGPGNIAEGMKMMTAAHGLLTQALQNFPAGSPQWKDCHKSLGMIAKHMAQSTPDASSQQTFLGDLMKNVAKNQLVQRIMQSRGQSIGGGGGPGGDPGSSVPGIPSPSTPLPGA